jgi:hypothetical protein
MAYIIIKKSLRLEFPVLAGSQDFFESWLKTP